MRRCFRTPPWPQMSTLFPRTPSAPTQTSYGSLRSTWAISQIPWDSRIQPDISIELKMDSCAPPPPLSFPSCFPSLIVWIPLGSSSQGNQILQDPTQIQQAWRVCSYPDLTPASPFSNPSMGGKEPSSAPGEGPWRTATAGGDGGLLGEAGSRKEGQIGRAHV